MSSRIECITKPDPHSSHEAIQYVGGTRANGGHFYIPRAECANDIRTGRESYYVQVGRDTIAVTAYEKQGVWYIRTKPDNTQKDNLLNLPQCG
jgi:hypothetical protein